jgi:DNA-binding transcriptional LysR family regulator
MEEAGPECQRSGLAVRATVFWGVAQVIALGAGARSLRGEMGVVSALGRVRWPACFTVPAAATSEPVEVTVIEAEPAEALGSVRDGQADLALVYHFHAPEPPRAWRAAAAPGSYTTLAADPLRLLVPAGHPLAGRPAVSLAEFAGDRWIHGWGEVGGVLDMLAAVSGFHPRVACRSSDYRFMTALVGAGVGVALVPGLALTGRPDVRDIPITPQPTRYVGAYLPQRHQPNPAAERLLAALRRRSSHLSGAGAT